MSSRNNTSLVMSPTESTNPKASRNLPILTKDNWFVYKKRMERFLTAKGLWAYVKHESLENLLNSHSLARQESAENRETRTPFDRSQNPTHQDFKDMTTGYLIDSIPDSIFQLVMDISSPCEIWKKLVEHHEKRGMFSTIQVRLKYYNTRLADCPDMETYLNRKDMLRHEYESITNNNLIDDDLVISLLLGLPEEYDDLVMVLSHQKDLSLTHCQRSLLHEYEKRHKSGRNINKKRHVMEDSGTSQKKKKSLSNNNVKSLRFCKYCEKKRRHTSDECFKNPKNKHVGPHLNSRTPKVNHLFEVPTLVPNDDDYQININDSSYSFPIHIIKSKRDKDNTLDKESYWLCDSGAACNICVDKSLFSNLKDANKNLALEGFQGTKLYPSGIGSVNLCFINNMGEHTILHLENVYYVPESTHNIISLGYLYKQFQVSFIYNEKPLLVREGINLINLTVHHTLPFLKVLPCKEHGKNQSKIHKCSPISWSMWHQRFGHLNYKSLFKLSNTNSINGFNRPTTNSESQMCQACLEGKIPKSFLSSSWLESESKTLSPLALVHADLGGPIPVPSFEEDKYFLILVDDYSCYAWIYFLKRKSDALKAFTIWYNLVSNQTSTSLKIFRSDNGGEFQKFLPFLQKHGIRHQTTVAYNWHQNGRSERYIRTIVNKALAMLSHSKLPKKFWAEALDTAVYLTNLSPTSNLPHGTTPFQQIWHIKPNVAHLRVFGCKCVVHVPKEKRIKFDMKGQLCLFMGYSLDKKAYRVYNLTTHLIEYAAKVEFFEQDFAQKNDFSSDFIFEQVGEDNEEFIPLQSEYTKNPNQNKNKSKCFEQVGVGNKRSLEELTNSSKHQDLQNLDNERFLASDKMDASNEERTSPRNSKQRIKRQAAINAEKKIDSTFLKNDQFDLFNINTVHDIWLDNPEPKTIEGALHYSNPERPYWLEAIQSELDSLNENKTWIIVDKPKDRRIVKCMWIFRRKLNSDGSVERYKARLVAKGYSQIEGVDYNETYSPVARLTSVRTLIALANSLEIEIHQMDVNTAFLYATLNEEIYMNVPKGIDNVPKNKVCKLVKSLYGLKQAPIEWYKNLHSTLTKMNFVASSVDSCIYKLEDNDHKAYIAVYVDDILICSTSNSLLDKIKSLLKLKYKMKDMGLLKLYLGVEINQDSDKITMSQEGYINRVLDKFKMINSNPSKTPELVGQTLSKEDSPKTIQDINEMKTKPYRQAVGCLMYIMIATRPDISHAVITVSKFLENPGIKHWTAVKRILRYLKGTTKLRLVYRRKLKHTSFKIEAFTDSDYANDVDNRRSVTGYIIKLNNCTISWRSKKQTSVALSTTGAEYMAISMTTQELIWLYNLLTHLVPKEQIEMPINLFSDCQGAIKLAKNFSYSGRTKHIDVRYHFIREHIQSQLIKLSYINTNDNTSDLFTKPLTEIKFVQFRKKLGLE